MAGRLITDYIARGLLAARPVTPNVGAGVSSFYYATDAGELYVWNGSAWVISGGSAPPPTVVRRGVVALSSVATGITLSGAPAAGNLLLAWVGGSNNVNTPASGWTLIDSNTFCALYAKVAGASESATQTPTTNAASGGIAMWEVANVSGLAIFPAERTISIGASAAPVFAVTPLRSGLILIAGTRTATAFIPTGATGDGAGSLISNELSTVAGVFALNYTVNAATAYSTTVNFSNSVATRRIGLVIV